MKRHATHPDWLVDDRGKVWRRERVFGCEHHPYGPPAADECGDEHVACAALVRGLWDELGTAAAIATVTGCTREQIDTAHQELGLCCAGHRWRNTGRIIEVGSLEQFVYTNMRSITQEHVDAIRRSLDGSVFLKELEGTGLHPEGARVVIPLHVGTPLPRSATAEAHYRLDRPGGPPAVE